MIQKGKRNKEMKKKTRYLAVLFCATALAACGTKNSTNDTKMTVEEIPITQEHSEAEEKMTQGAAEEEVTTGETEEAGTEEKTEEAIVVNGNEGIIRIGTIGTPYTEILTQAKKILANEGWDVQIEVYDDYVKMNQDVVSGTLDAHLFTHQTYLNSYNDVNGTGLVSVAPICYEIYGIYSALNQDLTNVKSGVVIGIPGENAKKARALLFLQEMGYVTLQENVGLTAVVDDVTENHKNIQFAEYTPETAADVFQTADYCVMGADQAILIGLEPEKDVLKEETPIWESAKTMVTLLVTTQERAEDEKMVLLEDAIKSDETKKYMTDTYKGAWELFP